jgi:predicted  nucleic acid-binding Zn-ribbon protein
MELNKQDIDDEFRDVRRLIEELSNNLKWQKEEHEKFVASMEGLETEVDNLVRQLKVMNRAVEGMAQILAIHLGVPLADLYWNH